MPIYSRNRVGGVGATVTANESYSDHDIGRIMYESAINQDRIFNAALARDFKEIDGTRNGTMLESELTAFREFSVKEAWANLKAALKKFWEKIKGVFRAAYAKLSVWVVRNGKAFVKLHRKAILAANVKDTKIPKYRKRKGAAIDDSLQKAAKALDIDKALAGGVADASDAVKAKLGTVIGKTSCDPADFRTEYMDYMFEAVQSDETCGSLGLDSTGAKTKLMDIVCGTASDASTKDLQKAAKAADKHLAKLIKDIDSAAAKATKDLEGDAKTAKADQYGNASKYVSAEQTATAAITKAQISAIKFSIKQARMVLGKMVAAGSGAKNEGALDEMSCWFEGADDFDSHEDVDPAEINAEDVASDPDVVVNIDVEANTDDCE